MKPTRFTPDKSVQPKMDKIDTGDEPNDQSHIAGGPVLGQENEKSSRRGFCILICIAAER
jgi:hypothetical protein